MLRLKPQQIHQRCKKKKKIESPEPKPFMTVPHTDSLPEEEHCKYEQRTWKTGPLLYPLHGPLPQRQPSYSKPSSPRTWLGRHFQNSDSFPSWIRSLHFWLSSRFQGFSLYFVFLVSAVWYRNHCYYSLSYRPSYSCCPCDVQASPPQTLLQLNLLYSMETTVEQREANMFSTLISANRENTGFLKSAFLSEDRLCFPLKADRGLSLGDCLVFCGLF